MQCCNTHTPSCSTHNRPTLHACAFLLSGALTPHFLSLAHYTCDACHQAIFFGSASLLAATPLWGPATPACFYPQPQPTHLSPTSEGENASQSQTHPLGRRVMNHVGLAFRTGTSAWWWPLVWLSFGKALLHQQLLQAPQLLVASSCTYTRRFGLSVGMCSLPHIPS